MNIKKKSNVTVVQCSPGLFQFVPVKYQEILGNLLFLKVSTPPTPASDTD